jgi:hypothetical protein
MTQDARISGRFQIAGPDGPRRKPGLTPGYRVVRLEDGERDRYTVLPGHFSTLSEAQREMELLTRAHPGGRFVLQLLGLA